ncbi:MAG: hypothetical protein R2710_17850 [Acidimicrobiales bacterium]
MARPFPRATRWVRRAFIGAFTVVVLTGIGLFITYRPGSSGLSRALIITHLVAVAIAAQAVVASGVLALMGPGRADHTARRVLGLVVSVLGLVVSLITGSLLGWDQLALFAVTSGDDIRGYRWVFGNTVDFVLIDSSVIEVDTVQRLLTVHVVSALVVVAAAVAVARTGRPNEGAHRGEDAHRE